MKPCMCFRSMESSWMLDLPIQPCSSTNGLQTNRTTLASSASTPSAMWKVSQCVCVWQHVQACTDVSGRRINSYPLKCAHRVISENSCNCRSAQCYILNIKGVYGYNQVIDWANVVSETLQPQRPCLVVNMEGQCHCLYYYDSNSVEIWKTEIKIDKNNMYKFIIYYSRCSYTVN